MYFCGSLLMENTKNKDRKFLILCKSCKAIFKALYITNNRHDKVLFLIMFFFCKKAIYYFFKKTFILYSDVFFIFTLLILPFRKSICKLT